MMETPRLLIGPLEDEDFDAMFAFWSDAETLLHFPRPWTRKEVQDLIDKHGPMAHETGLGFQAVIRRETNELIGDCGITIQNIDGVDEHEIGYHFSRHHWGHGYATEAAQALKAFGFDKLGLKKLCSYMADDHHPSRRVAERNGMTLEKRYNNPGNRDLPTVMYSVFSD